jgi:hypothetical protein
MIQQGKDLKDMSVIELKAMGYDLVALLEQTQRNIQVVNQMIQQKGRPEPVEAAKIGE